MFNIKNKIYVQDISELDINNKFILIEGTNFNGVNFDISNGVSNGLVYRGTSLQDLLDTHFSGSVYSLYLQIIQYDNLRIFVEDPADYDKLFIYTFIELLTTFGLTTNTAFINNYLEKKTITRQLAQNATTDFQALHTTLSATYTGSGQLYDTTKIEEVPFEGVIQMYQAGAITKTQADTKLSFLTGNMLRDYILGFVYNKIVHLLPRYPVIMRTYTSDNNITTPILVNAAITSDTFLTKLVINKNVDIATDLVNITTLIDACNANDPDADAGQNAIDFTMFKDLYLSNDIDAFIANSEAMAQASYFGMKQGKFNELLIFTNYGT